MATITVRQLNKSFGSKQVLSGVDLDLEARQSLVIIGASGSGKSVLIKSILGIITPDSGEIKVDNTELFPMCMTSERQAFMRRCGMLFQGGALFDSLKVWENVAFGLIQVQQMSKVQAKELALRKLAAVGLKPEVAMLSPAELSGGMQKRVALARAIAMSPEILFFDEPTTGLDPIMSAVINELIVHCSAELGASTLTITHDMASVRRIASKVALLHQGKIKWTGSVQEMDSTDNPYVRQFINGDVNGPMAKDDLLVQ